MACKPASWGFKSTLDFSVNSKWEKFLGQKATVNKSLYQKFCTCVARSGAPSLESLLNHETKCWIIPQSTIRAGFMSIPADSMSHAHFAPTTAGGIGKILRQRSRWNRVANQDHTVRHAASNMTQIELIRGVIGHVGTCAYYFCMGFSASDWNSCFIS
jgi:hypothetical protein